MCVIGVRSQYRQKGLGSHLVKALLKHVSHLTRCKVMYLHVLATNNLAVGKLYYSMLIVSNSQRLNRFFFRVLLSSWFQRAASN